MDVKKFENLADSINKINLNAEDLMESVLDYVNIYIKEHTDDASQIDLFLNSPEFKRQTMAAAREAVVLSMSAIALDDTVPFENLFDKCIDLKSQKDLADIICENDSQKNLMSKFLRSLRKEMFSRVYSRNKHFNNIALINQDLLKFRFDAFMGQKF